MQGQKTETKIIYLFLLLFSKHFLRSYRDNYDGCGLKSKNGDFMVSRF